MATKKKKPFTWYDPALCGSPEPMPGRCGVKLQNRSTFCMKHPMKGSKRCNKHSNRAGRSDNISRPKGSKAPSPNKGAKRKAPALDESFYGDTLLPGEAEVYDMIKMGDLEEELVIARYQLRRVLQAQQAYEIAKEDPDNVDDDGFVSVELHYEQAGTVAENGDIIPGPMTVKRIRRRNDYTEHILKFTRLISTLEASRSEILKSKPKDMTNSPLMTLAKAIGALRTNGGTDNE